LSAWIWATQPVRVHGPALNDGTQYAVDVLDIDRTPALHVLTSTVDVEAEYVQVILRPEPQAIAADASVDVRSPLVIYYDQVVLAEMGHPSVNRVRNGSARPSGATRGAPYLSSWFQSWTGSARRGSISTVRSSCFRAFGRALAGITFSWPMVGIGCRACLPC
jgi:hypothetical protein